MAGISPTNGMLLAQGTSTYRGLNTMIQQHQVPTCTYAPDVQVKYGIAVEVANPISEVRVWHTSDCYAKDLKEFS